MRTGKQLWLGTVFALLMCFGMGNAQTVRPQAGKATPTTATDLIAAANQSKTSSQDLLKTQEGEISAATKKLDELRQLVTEGLVARVELEQSEQSLANMRRNLEETRKTIVTSDEMIAELTAADELARSQSLASSPIESNSRSFLKPTILRYGGQGAWSLASMASIQTFFVTKFGQSLPMSAVGQSATHNRLGYDHRNAVDVALHPDSVQGRALINYLQSQGVPFLAFRAALPGVATGPHIHIGAPSHKFS